jgi:GTP pyrophosphokinase
MPVTQKKENDNIFEKLNSFNDSDRARILQILEMKQDISVETASILLDLGMDADTIIAALLHQNPDISGEQFGSAVNSLVQGLKKIDNIKTKTKTNYEAQNVRNMLFALTDDIRVIFIIIAEKLQNLRVLDSSMGEERKAAAEECLDVYAPITDRLGISWIKNEMEDYALKFLHRETYQQIKNLVAEKREQRNHFLLLVQNTIRNETEAAGINAEVESRAKHFYSVYMKMRKRGISADKIHDLLGVRIICDSIDNCYTLLGIVHRQWKPLHGGFKDYIANPKKNGYRSLHTTIIYSDEPDGEPVSDDEKRILEIQIRTREMHQIAEYGAASHWLYKKGSPKDKVTTHEIGIINKLNERKQGDEDSGEISPFWLDDIKQEILLNWVYVFTPQGKIIKLPAGATPIDFAYHVHTAVGEHCIGAKANGHIIPLNSQLKNTQVVEILTSQSAHPNINWLNIAKASKTRSKIRSWLEKNDESYGTEKTAEVKKKTAIEEKPQPESAPVPFPPGGIQKNLLPVASVLQVCVDDEKNLLIRFARCCNPIIGDSIIGYVSRGRGIIIHRKDCNNLVNNPEYEKRIIAAEWDAAGSALVKRFIIEAKSKTNLFAEIEGAIRKRQGHLIEGHLKESSTNSLTGTFTMQLAQADDLKPLIKNIQNIPGVLGVKLLN